MIVQSLLLVLIVFFSIFLVKFFDRKTKPRAHLKYPPSPPPAIPIIGHLHLLKPLVHQAFRDLSLQYGPLLCLRLGFVKFVVVSTPSLAKEFLKTNELIYSSRKMNMAINMVTYQNATFAFAPYDTYWKFMKRLSTTELLGNKTIGQFQPIRTRELHEFIQILFDKSKAQESVNLTEALLRLSNNIISQMMLGIKSSGTESQAEQARALVREVTQIFGEFNVSDFIGFLENFDVHGFKKRAMDIHRRYDALLEKIISDREELRRKSKVEGCEDGNDKVMDFLDILLDVAEQKDCEVELTRNHIKSLILDFFTAATDTTSISVEWTIAELLNNPKVLKKAQEEVETVIGKKRLVCEADGPNLPYINAIIKETMRLHPPIPIIMRKGIEDCVVNGNKIPKGSIVCVNIWAMGRDPNVWEDPLKFKAERFLEGERSSIDIKGHNFELLPFGSGRRGCPGMPLALRELPTIIGALIQCFEWKIFDSKDHAHTTTLINMDERPGLTAPRANDLIVVPVARLNPTHFLHI
ncbi:licodione synthase [Cajanus cajan]|uniref:Licodione synthase n=1 Tax=Cajanus cajan TaxID=3821 RepID=A0A151TN06_CAJCA|nr:licodione synthase [Cajanus cajan]KYP68429.1 Licodione synthase [Cajanus cajan]